MDFSSNKTATIDTIKTHRHITLFLNLVLKGQRPAVGRRFHFAASHTALQRRRAGSGGVATGVVFVVQLFHRATIIKSPPSGKTPVKSNAIK
jgi:hypothetical protein